MQEAFLPSATRFYGVCRAGACNAFNCAGQLTCQRRLLRRIASGRRRCAPGSAVSSRNMSASGPVPIRGALALAQCGQCRIVAGARRGGGQSQQGAPLRIVQLALRRHRLGDVVGQRPLRRRPVIGALQDRRARLIGGGTVQRAERGQCAGSLSPRRASAAASQQGAALDQVRRKVRRDGCIERRQRSRRIALAQPQRRQPRAETGPCDTRGRRLHQLLQHRPGALRQIERHQPIGELAPAGRRRPRPAGSRSAFSSTTATPAPAAPACPPRRRAAGRRTCR